MNFGLSAAVAASGVSESVIRAWFDRGLIPIGKGGRQADGRASPREIPAGTVLQLAIAGELVRLGFTAGRACRLALSFSDSGKPGRLPGQLFADDKTLLIARPGLEAAEIVRASDIASIFANDTLSFACVAIVDLNEIYRNVAGSLGIPLPAAARL